MIYGRRARDCVRRALYVVIPAAALGLVVANAFFGHLVFGYAYDKTINKYSVYVHLQPEWASHPGNIIYDVTNVWSGPAPAAPGRDGDWTWPAAGGDDDPDDVSSLATYNHNNLQYQNSKSYVELRHEFSDCGEDWRPIPYRYAVDSVRSWFELTGGMQVYERLDAEPEYVRAARDDPYVMMFPSTPNASYGDDVQAGLVRDGYAQFIPVCTAAGTAGAGTAGISYDYSLMVNHPGIGFDVHFAKPAGSGSAAEFELYDAPGCGAVNHNSFAGTCHGVEPGSGLLVVLPDALEQSLTRVRISMHERVT